MSESESESKPKKKKTLKCMYCGCRSKNTIPLGVMLSDNVKIELDVCKKHYKFVCEDIWGASLTNEEIIEKRKTLAAHDISEAKYLKECEETRKALKTYKEELNFVLLDLDRAKKEKKKWNKTVEESKKEVEEALTAAADIQKRTLATLEKISELGITLSDIEKFVETREVFSKLDFRSEEDLKRKSLISEYFIDNNNNDNKS